MNRDNLSKFPLSRCLRKYLLPVMLLTSFTANAGDFYVSGDIGLAETNQNNFEGSRALRLAGGYKFQQIGMEVGIVDYDDMDHVNYPDSKISIEGYTTHAYWRQKFNNVVGIDLGLGLLNWNADSTLFGNSNSKDSGSSPFIDIRLVTEFNDTIAAHVSTRYLSDVSGADIFNLSVGATVSF